MLHFPKKCGLYVFFSCVIVLKFFSSRYKYETSVSHNVVSNSSEGALPCHANQSETAADESLDLVTRTGAVLSEPGDYVRFGFHCCTAIITTLHHPQPVKNQPARLCGSTCSLGTCCAELERLPSCHWVSLIWTTSPEKKTLHSIWVGLFILPLHVWSFFLLFDFFFFFFYLRNFWQV